MHDQLQAIFRKVFNDSGLILTDTMSADDIANWDSLAHIDLMTSIEEEFNIKFSVREMRTPANVGELKKMISEKIAK